MSDQNTDDDQSGMMGWWTGDALDTPIFLKTRMVFGILIGFCATLFFTYILLQMERQTTSYNAAIMEAAIGERDTQLELEEESDAQSTRTSHTSTSRQHQAGSSNSDYVHATGDHDDDMSIHSTTSSKMGVSSISPKSVIGKITSSATADGLFKPGDSRRRLLSTSQHIQVFVHVLIVILFIYLLLVFLPGSIWLSFVAVVIVWVMALQSYLRDEIFRRQRIDRVVTMVGLFSIIAGSLALVTYCHLALKEGSIYEGPARIIGYDTSNYSNKDGTTMRADVVVAWGGSWACPDTDATQCTATVQGALCETEYDPNSSTTSSSSGEWGNRRTRRHRRVQSNNVVAEVEEYQEEKELEEVENGGDAVTESPYIEEAEEVIEAEDEEVTELAEELDTETEIHVEEEDTLMAEVNVLESNSTDAEEENKLTDITYTEALEAGVNEGAAEELETENENLQNELDGAEELIGELDEEINEIVGSETSMPAPYSYDDVYYEDEYWQTQDWDSIWGEYACEDLFDGDISSEELNLEVAPGADHWPTINIYGSCNTCTAYILDYYSTEHFQNIRQYETQAYLYYVTGLFFMIGAAILTLFERKRPNKENKIVLLSQDGGVAA